MPGNAGVDIGQFMKMKAAACKEESEDILRTNIQWVPGESPMTPEQFSDQEFEQSSDQESNNKIICERFPGQRLMTSRQFSAWKLKIANCVLQQHDLDEIDTKQSAISSVRALADKLYKVWCKKEFNSRQCPEEDMKVYIFTLLFIIEWVSDIRPSGRGGTILKRLE